MIGAIAAHYVASAPPSGFASVAAAKSPKIWLRLNQTSGTTATDSSGNGYHGTYVGTPGFGASSLLASDTDAAVTFSGDDRVSVAYAAGWGDGGMSLFLRAKPADLTGTKQIISRRTATGTNAGGFTVRMDSASLMFYPFSDFPGNTINFGTLTAGTTYSVGLSYNGTSGQYEAYLNGSLVGTKVTTYRVSTLALGIGASSDTLDEPFNGVIDEVLYTNTYWSATDQADLHAAAIAP